MDSSPRLRRSKSLKSIFSARARRDSVVDHEEALPPTTPAKTTLIQLHVTADDLKLKPTPSRPQTSSSLQVPSARHTWPQTAREKRPGTYAFNEIPTLIPTPWEQDRSLRSGPRRSRSTTRSAASSHACAQLPREILHCILDHLRDARLSGSRLNVPSYRNDLRKLCIVNKQWHRVAREHLYREIWLPWAQNSRSTERSVNSTPGRGGQRLRLLLRTLREAPGLAHLVRRLCIPSSMIRQFDVEVFLDVRARSNVSSADAVLSTLCEIIRTCPNLQSLSGHHLLACEQTAEILQTLASRPKLKEHVWNLPRSASDWQALLKPGMFVDYHTQWRQLETLVLWRDGVYSDGLGVGEVTALLQRLPSLKHLMLKGLSRSEFHNGTLLMLPALNSLRLEDTPGVTDHGLQQLIHSRLAMSLERFSLVGLELTSLRTVQALLENLPRLRRFSLMQHTSPELQEVFSFTGSAFSIASPTLEHLHWNALLPGNAVPILANAIAANKFPNLRSIKIPCDSDGAVQKLCRPIQQRSLSGNEIGEHLDDFKTDSLEYRKTARFHEIEAQLRAKRARKDSVFSVTVEDEDGVERFQWAGSYLGSIASKVRYELEPDIEGQVYSHSRIEDLSRPAWLERGFEQVVGLDVLF